MRVAGAHSSGGKASGGRINATKCRNEFGCRPDVRIIACVSQQTDGWNNSHKGERIWEKTGPSMAWSWPWHAGLPPRLSFYPSLSLRGYRERIPSIIPLEVFFKDTIHVNQTWRLVIVLTLVLFFICLQTSSLNNCRKSYLHYSSP